jgi:hypothetical protein
VYVLLRVLSLERSGYNLVVAFAAFGTMKLVAFEISPPGGGIRSGVSIGGVGLVVCSVVMRVESEHKELSKWVVLSELEELNTAGLSRSN